MTDSEYDLALRQLAASERLASANEKLAFAMRRLAHALEVLTINYTGTLPTPVVQVSAQDVQ